MATRESGSNVSLFMIKMAKALISNKIIIKTTLVKLGLRLRFLDILRLLRIKIQPKARIAKRQYVAIIDLFPFFRRFPVYHDLCMPQRRDICLPSCHIQYGMAFGNRIIGNSYITEPMASNGIFPF